MMSKKKQINRDEAVTQDYSLEEILAAVARDEAVASDATRFVADEDFVTDRLRAEFVAQVRVVMKKKKIKNPAALAKLTGLSAPRISAILQEEGNITLRVIAKLALALDTKVRLHFGAEDEERFNSYKATAMHQHLLVLHSKASENAPVDTWVNQQKHSTYVPAFKHGKTRIPAEHGV